MNHAPWNLIRRVPTTVDEANEQRQRSQDKRLNAIERAFAPPLCIEKQQNAGEVMLGEYATIPGLEWTTTIESAWRITANIDWSIEANGANYARCLVGGVAAGGGSVALLNSTVFVRAPAQHVWKTGLVAAGTLIVIQAKHELAGVGRTFQVHTEMIVDQVT